MALVLLTVVVVLGITARSGRPLLGLPRFAVATVHRNASLLAVFLLAVHAENLLLDPYAQLRALDLLLPFVGVQRPLWLGLGTLAGDVILVLVGVSLLRRRIGVRIWRTVHWTAYAAWPLALLHGLGTGTDAGQLWLRVTAAACAAAVLASVGWRCSARFTQTAHPRTRS